MSSHVVFIIPKFEKIRTTHAISPPFSFLFLAATLEKAGHSIELIDERVEANVGGKIKRALKKKPLCVCISTMSGPQIIYGLRISQLVRAINDDIPIAWGGIHPSLCPLQTIQNPNVDIVVKGEGDLTIVDLVRSLEAKSDLAEVKGISFKRNGDVISTPMRDFINLDLLPRPAWHLIKDRIKDYLRRDNTLSIFSSRGCPHRCAFCYNLQYHRRKWRARNSDNVFDELKYLKDNFKINSFHFSDDNFCANKERLFQICDKIQKAKLNIQWECDLRVDYITDDFIKKLCQGGLKGVYVGIESGSPKIINNINKDIVIEQVLSANEILSKYNIETTYSFMIGFFDEQQEDLQMSVCLAKNLMRVNSNSRILLSIFTPYPGSDLFTKVKEMGFREPRTLIDWGRLNWGNTEGKSWIKNPTYYEVFHKIWYFANMSFVNIPLRRKIILFPVHLVAKMRFERNLFNCALEFKLINYILNKSGISLGA